MFKIKTLTAIKSALFVVSSTTTKISVSLKEKLAKLATNLTILENVARIAFER